MPKLLIIDDQTLTIRALREALEEALSGSGTDISTIKINRTCSLTACSPSVREFYGSSAEFLSRAAGADILVVHKAPVTEKVFRKAENLKLVACARNNPVNVDLAAAARRGILVINAPGRASEATAELTVGLMLALARNIVQAGLLTGSAGPAAWDYNARIALEGIELKGKTAGIIGFGRVGREVAGRLKAFGMNILVYSTHTAPEEIIRLGARPATLEELLQKSDFVTLHPRLTEKNKNLIGEKQLNLMKRSAYLINTARGKLIDEKALYRVLREEKIRGAALDVLAEEPPAPDNPLLGLKNVLITPHLGGKTREVPVRAAGLLTADIKRFLAGEKPLNIVSSLPEPEA
ncbi:MAG: 2-hydroxyacid dehydrogenase [Armatimonadetes bacterium]|nr:2-hydroxyacid dehydrogenase [Armatimonadota bacterium]